MKTKLLATLFTAVFAAQTMADVIHSYTFDFGNGATATIEIDVTTDAGFTVLTILGTNDQAGNEFNTFGISATTDGAFNNSPNHIAVSLTQTVFRSQADQSEIFTPLFLPGQTAPATLDTHLSLVGDILDPGGHVETPELFSAGAALQPSSWFAAGEIARLVVNEGDDIEVEHLSLGYAGNGSDAFVQGEGFLLSELTDGGGGDDPFRVASGPGVVSSDFDGSTLTVVVNASEFNVDSFFDIDYGNFQVDSFFDITYQIEIVQDFDNSSAPGPINAAELRLGDGAESLSASSGRFPIASLNSDDQFTRLYTPDENGHLNGPGDSVVVSGTLFGAATDSEGAGSASLGVRLVPTPAAFLPGLAMLAFAATRRRRA